MIVLFLNLHHYCRSCVHLSGKESKSVFDFLTYSRETGFSFSYWEVENLFLLIGASDEIDKTN